MWMLTVNRGLSKDSGTSISMIHRWRFAEAIEPMPQAQNGMPPEHARSGVTHDDFDLLAPVTLIAMHRAIRAGRLFGAEPATVQTQCCVIE